MNLKRIHHIAVICSDYEASKDFYVNKLGLKPIREVYREERQSYKLDLALQGSTSSNSFHSRKPQAVQVTRKHAACAI
jgi:glyoxylase I family protein